MAIILTWVQTPTERGKPLGLRAIESGCRTHSGAGAGDWRVELLEDGGRLRVRHGWSLENSEWTFQVGRPAGTFFAPGSGVFSGGHGAARNRGHGAVVY